MDRRKKVKCITSVVCLVISVVALYLFLFVAELSRLWRGILTVLAVSWIVSAIIQLVECRKKQQKRRGHPAFQPVEKYFRQAGSTFQNS